MKFLSVRDFRRNAARVWREMVATSNGRPVAVLTAVDEGSVEETLAAWRQARATKAIADLQRESVEKGTDETSMDEVDAEIQAARRGRRPRST
jgi:antitoxin (DNA-binding transcriptional repressor) of toxin-antitoxin stability system